MTPLYIFVIVLGLFFLTAALRNWEGIYSILEFEVISGLFGEGAARLLAGVIGIGCVGFGAWYLLVER
jgi:hypothetical protein